MQLHDMFSRPQHAELLNLLAESHFRAAMKNQNTSSAVALAVYGASGSLDKAIAAAALTQGGLHAPIAQARALLESSNPVARAEAIIARKQRVPGFGNSFHKHGIDPAFLDLYNELPIDILITINALQNAIGRKLHPNAAIITAATCIVADLPQGAESTIFTYCRTPAWVKLCLAKRNPQVGA